jgi:precorrin-2 dehydrogenase/sirohydrochlorin ferrochelatase
MNPYYPMFLNVKAKKCIVIGAGIVARRKTDALLEHGADITVIGPRVCRALSVLAGKRRIQLIRRHYQSGDLRGAFIAIAASSNNEINIRAAQEARKRKVLVNVVDNPELSDFIVPASVRRGDFAIAISTGGNSPALARKIRMKLEKEFGDEYAALAILVGEIRRELRINGIKIRSKKWQDAMNLNVLVDLLKKGGTDRARMYLRDNLMGGGPSER